MIGQLVYLQQILPVDGPNAHPEEDDGDDADDQHHDEGDGDADKGGGVDAEGLGGHRVGVDNHLLPALLRQLELQDPGVSQANLFKSYNLFKNYKTATKTLFFV